MFTAIHGVISSAIADLVAFVGWDVSKAVGKDFNAIFSGEETSLRDITVNPTGTKIYAIGQANDTVYEYDVSPAWDLPTAVYSGKSLDTTTESDSPKALIFGDAGTKLYILKDDGSLPAVYQYTVSPAYDIDTAVYASKSKVIGTSSTPATGLVIGDGGTKMYISDSTADEIIQWTLSTAWDVSTASLASKVADVSNEAPQVDGLDFNSAGTKMYVLTSSGADHIYQYSLSPAWDVSTASYDSILINVDFGTGRFPFGMTLTDSGTKLIIARGDQRAELWDLGTADNISTAALGTVGSLISEDTTPYSVHVIPDGTKMFVSGNTSNTAYQYTLSTAYDVTSATYDSKSLVFTTQDGNPLGIVLSVDGTKLYMVGSASDAVYQYTLSPAFDIDTAVYANKSADISDEDGNGYGIDFSQDGSKMYILGNFNKRVYQYTLGTAWDVSSASYASKSALVDDDTSPYDVSFKPDGKQMFVIGIGSDAVYQYTLGTAWDVSTATYDSVQRIIQESTNPIDVQMVVDGATVNMYVVGFTNDTIYHFTFPS